MITRIGGTNRYSNIVVYDRNVYLSGVVPLITCDISGSTLYEQTSEVLSIIDKNLQAVGTSKAFILSMTIYLVDETMYEEMNRAFDEWMASTPNCAPARATIGNVKFPNPKWKIEIVCNAAIPKTHTSHNSYGSVNYVI
jgi:enamine deaminase RidA (YjgF/YER057c/UK114 family)